MNIKHENKVQYSWRQFIRDYWSRMRGRRARFIGGTLIRVTGDILRVLNVVLFAEIISRLAAGTDWNGIWPLLLGMMGAAMYRPIALRVAKYLVHTASESIAGEVSIDGTEALLKTDAEWHESENLGSKTQRVENGAIGFRDVGRYWINNITEIVVTLISVMAIMFSRDVVAALLLLGFCIFQYSAHLVLQRTSVRLSVEADTRKESMNGALVEYTQAIRTVRALALVPTTLHRFQYLVRDWVAAANTRIGASQVRGTITTVLGLTFWLAGIGYISWGVTQGWFTIALLIMFDFYVDQLWEAMFELMDVTEEMAIAKSRVGRVMALLALPQTMYTQGTKKFPKYWKTLEFRNVSFSYGGREVLKNISFTVRRGERIGIVGVSGAGKSTLFKLLLKERGGYSGEILFDTTPLFVIATQEYLGRIAVVLQDTEVFNMSLQQNIEIAGKKNLSILSKIITMSQLRDVVKKLPQGIKTIVGEKGVKLSGGERQRLGIARALYRQPEMLLLDEATSHLDVATEHKIQKALHTAFTSATAIVIAHRLATLKEMDRIIVIDKGKIVEQGSFAELSENRGVFYRLWQQQKL